ncbi:general transcription factor iih polypeptide 5 gtf2h5 [Cystoisospora suis]|uniref:General transcription and DNA repair factor IIH subunit TFB5 n=1 Tax=Cystoisospora suis TaxID=483139 RepID=A0A2C6KHV9_9APIC|nr:general transcription factor iih polypeptide 5 gtf2h5 [Cystoisospora suis]
MRPSRMHKEPATVQKVGVVFGRLRTGNALLASALSASDGIAPCLRGGETSFARLAFISSGPDGVLVSDGSHDSPLHHHGTMVAALKGVLVKCDPPTMEIILLLNETRDFIIEQLNEEYVLCRESVFEFLEEEVTKRLELAERQTAEFQREVRQSRQQQQQVLPDHEE